MLPQQKQSVESLLEHYKDVNITEEEEQLAILQAKKKKYTEIKTAEYWEKVRKESIYPVYKAEEFNSIILKKAFEKIPEFELDEFNEEIIFDLSCYFTSDKRFEEKGYSMNKGIILFGDVGCGKTSIMNLFSSNQLSSYIMVNCHEISQEYSRGGYEEIERYFKEHNTAHYKKYFGQDKLGFCFDDLGTEDLKKHFGNSSNVMAEIILSRYARKDLLKHKTHITTNLNAEQIRESYGDRIVSRMREMFNLIQFKRETPDRRT